MITVFVQSLRLHLRCFLGAFSRRGRRIQPLGPRRLLFLLAGVPLLLSVQGAHWIGFALDELWFRGYRRVTLDRPLFVTGIPRSGTTFVHRTLAGAQERFTSLTMWQALLAPSVTERYLVKALARIDRALGGFGDRSLRALVRRLSGDFEAIHAVGLDAPEEDYLTLLPAGGCFLLVLAFPASAELWGLGQLDRQPAGRREPLLRYYRACLQKHLYVEGAGRCLLSKNAAFASWIPDLRQTFPGARFLVCVREPVAALSSQLSSIADGFAALGGDPRDPELVKRFEATFAHAYALLEKLTAEAPPDCAVVDQGALKDHPDRALRRALEHLGEPLTPALEAALERAHVASANHRSEHRHAPASYGLSKGTIGPCLLQSYEAIVARPAPPAGSASATATGPGESTPS